MSGFSRGLPEVDFSPLLPGPARTYLQLAEVGNSDEQGSAYLYFQRDDLLCEVRMIPGAEPRTVKVGMLRSGDGAWGYLPVRPGDIVHVAFPDGDESAGVIVSREKAAEETPHPATVAGMSTDGPAIATLLRTAADEPIAVEAGAEILVQAGGVGLEVKAETILMDGTVHLGAALATKPAPPTPGPLNVLPGSPGTPAPIPQITNPTSPAYVGPADGIVRAKDRYQSTAGTDPTWWAFMGLLDALLTACASLNPVTIAPALTAYNTFKATLGNGVPKVPDSIVSAAQAAAPHTARD